MILFWEEAQLMPYSLWAFSLSSLGVRKTQIGSELCRQEKAAIMYWEHEFRVQERYAARYVAALSGTVIFNLFSFVDF